MNTRDRDTGVEPRSTPPELTCPRGCVEVEGCGCEWNQEHEAAPAGSLCALTDRASEAGACDMALADLLATVPPGHRSEPWSWEDEERDIRIRLCLCCGQVGHYQETVEARIAEHGLTEGVCIGDDGRLHDGHHRVIAALHLGIERVPLETKDEADSRWRIDHGGTMWELRQFGDVHPGEAWSYVQSVRQQARDFVAREGGTS